MEKQKECDQLKEAFNAANAHLIKRLMKFAQVLSEKEAVIEGQQKMLADFEVVSQKRDDEFEEQQLFKNQLQQLHSITVGKVTRLRSEIDNMRHKLISSEMDLSIVQETFELIRTCPIAQSGKSGDTAYTMKLSIDDDVLMVDVSVFDQETALAEASR